MNRHTVQRGPRPGQLSADAARPHKSLPKIRNGVYTAPSSPRRAHPMLNPPPYGSAASREVRRLPSTPSRMDGSPAHPRSRG